MKPLYIIGGGGFAGEIVDAIEVQQTEGVAIQGIFDDDIRLKTTPFRGFPFLGTTLEFISNTPPGALYFITIGNNLVRERLATEFTNSGKKAFAVIHPSASVSAKTDIAEGVYIAAFAFIGPRCKVGEHVIVNVNASVGHDSQLEPYCQVCPGARVSGYCTVGRGAFLGSNSVLAPAIKAGSYAKLAAGSFAYRNIPEQGLATGVPAKVVIT